MLNNKDFHLHQRTAIASTTAAGLRTQHPDARATLRWQNHARQTSHHGSAVAES
jgi:hypothetical protein